MARLNLIRDQSRDFTLQTSTGQQWQGLVWVAPGGLDRSGSRAVFQTELLAPQIRVLCSPDSRQDRDGQEQLRFVPTELADLDHPNLLLQ
jgi:hypothetical protein